MPELKVCKAVEWVYSADCTSDSIDRAVAAYCKREEEVSPIIFFDQESRTKAEQNEC